MNTLLTSSLPFVFKHECQAAQKVGAALEQSGLQRGAKHSCKAVPIASRHAQLHGHNSPSHGPAHTCEQL